MIPVLPSTSTRPKNCRPKQGARFSPCSALQPFWNTAFGPNVLSSSPGGPGPGMQRAGDEFPERLEILEGGAIRIVMMRGGVVHVGGQPERVPDTGAFH